jgi:hypothetical protein
MTVAELIEMMQRVDQGLEVVIYDSLLDHEIVTSICCDEENVFLCTDENYPEEDS